MNSKITHIKNLIHFAYVDNHLHEKEKEYIHKVGNRLGLDQQVIEEELKNPPEEAPSLPTNEVLRFMLLDDIFNVIAVDHVLTDEEISECKRVAKHFGFEEEVINSLLDELKKHLDEGFMENRTSLFIKNQLYQLTSNNYTDAKYD